MLPNPGLSISHDLKRPLTVHLPCASQDWTVTWPKLGRRSKAVSTMKCCEGSAASVGCLSSTRAATRPAPCPSRTIPSPPIPVCLKSAFSLPFWASELFLYPSGFQKPCVEHSVLGGHLKNQNLQAAPPPRPRDIVPQCPAACRLPFRRVSAFSRAAKTQGPAVSGSETISEREDARPLKILPL